MTVFASTHTTGHADGKPQDVDERIYFVSEQVPDGDVQIISPHGSAPEGVVGKVEDRALLFDCPEVYRVTEN